MAAVQNPLSIFSANPCSYKLHLSSKPPDSIRLHISNSLSSFLSQNSIFPPKPLSSKKQNRDFSFELCSSLQEIAVEEPPEETQDLNAKRKLYVFNLPWSLSVVDIKNLFGQCGTVTDVEIIKQKNGKSRGYAFVTMASGEEALAVIDKFDSHEISGRVIRVELAKRFKKPSPPRPTAPSAGETLHKIYVSNLAWKVRSSHLRDFFSENYKPVSARIVFDSASKRAAGYGFVSFATKEEAEAAISGLDGKELMGRPLHLKFSQKKVNESGSDNEEEHSSGGQLEA
ncbi:29 kDa ribonucleoprotein, chloroplastic [Quillaja saponaria]|uniref:29 kDa ribonucleoprotein, chloroplastic n=1 Tax=Quillaja saponaria TaxID=32244 RepID=A0AAD7PFY6_QUISA|nr:29 kDa ribonucleoprotein, chloroplastic [Quillaja saponaria]